VGEGGGGGGIKKNKKRKDKNCFVLGGARPGRTGGRGGKTGSTQIKKNKKEKKPLVSKRGVGGGGGGGRGGGGGMKQPKNPEASYSPTRPPDRSQEPAGATARRPRPERKGEWAGARRNVLEGGGGQKHEGEKGERRPHRRDFKKKKEKGLW